MNRKKVKNAIKELKSARLLDEKIAIRLEVQEAKTLAFYMLPRIQKSENSGKPVTSSVNCYTTSVSQNVDYHLQPHVKESSFYIKDSTDFIKKINNLGKIPESSILVTMDVCSLYTNIPHKESIKAVETTSKCKNKPERVIVTFFEINSNLKQFYLEL